MPTRPPILLLIVSVVACRQTPTYTGTGDVLAVEAQRLQVTIRHDDVPGLMPAMTMDFPVASQEVLSGVSAGARVRFDLRRDGDRLTITRMQPANIAQGARPGLHDHRPHHGGVVAMAGLLHLEATALPDGLVRVYLTDVWRRPLPLTGVTGSVRLHVPDGPSRTMVLVERAGALEASGPPLPGSEVIAHVSIMRDGQSLDFHYALPLRAGAMAAALIPSGSCSPPPAAVDTEGRRPRCILVFPNRITAVATAPKASVALVSVLNGGVTAWRMPDVTLLTGFAAPPPMVVSIDDPPHGEAATAMAMSPEGGEAIVAIERRLLRYTLTAGRLERALPDAPGMVRSVVWSSDGQRLLMTAFSDAAAHILDARDGRELRRIAVEGEGAAVAFAPDGQLAAIGDENGRIVLVDVPDGAPRPLAETRRSVTALGFAGDRVVAGGPEGVLRTWEARAGTVVAESVPGPAILRLAVAPGDNLVATVDLDSKIRIREVATGATRETLALDADTYALAWAGSVLLSGGSDGTLALWDLP